MFNVPSPLSRVAVVDASAGLPRRSERGGPAAPNSSSLPFFTVWHAASGRVVVPPKLRYALLTFAWAFPAHHLQLYTNCAAADVLAALAESGALLGEHRVWPGRLLTIVRYEVEPLVGECARDVGLESSSGWSLRRALASEFFAPGNGHVRVPSCAHNRAIHSHPLRVPSCAHNRAIHSHTSVLTRASSRSRVASTGLCMSRTCCEHASPSDTAATTSTPI